MAVTIALPSALQPFAGGSTEVTLEQGPTNVGEVLCTLAGLHPGVMDRVVDERGQVRRHVNVFVDGESIRFLQGMRTPVREGSVVDIVPAVSGG